MIFKIGSVLACLNIVGKVDQSLLPRPQLHDTGFITHRIAFHIGLGGAVTRRRDNPVSLHSVFAE